MLMLRFCVRILLMHGVFGSFAIFAGGGHPSASFVSETTSFLLAGVPDDPLLLDSSRTYAPQLLNLFTAWDFQFATDDVVIAVIDTGIAHNHPEFAGRILPGRDLIHDNDNPEDDQGHGTHVAGIVAAAGNNGQGVAGVCGFCKLLPIKVVNEAQDASAAGIAEGIRYAADHGADIALLSLSRQVGDLRIEDAVEYAQAQGVLIIAAVGNGNRDTPTYPAAYPGVLGVTATTMRDDRWRQSNYGDFVDIAAPGDNILSTYYDLDNEDGGYLAMSGTSMAAPFVAGLAGLLLAQNPDRSADDLARLITTTAIDLGAPGFDPIFGYGRIDPVAALMAEALAAPPTAVLHGFVWHDANLNDQHDDDDLIGLPRITLRILDAQQRLVGLTNTRRAGDWRWIGSAPATYTITAGLPPSMVVPGANQRQVSVTTDVDQVEINFPTVTLPKAADIQNFAATRANEAISLSWTVSPLVQTIQVERAIAATGAYTVVATVANDEFLAASAQNQFTDALPEELQSETIFYRVQLLPGNIVVGPLMVVWRAPLDPPSKPLRIFLPFVQGQ
jgi:hypothetical protein